MSFPGPMAVRLGYDATLLAAIAGRLARAVMQDMRHGVKQQHGLASVASLHGGVVTVVQRFRSDLGLYVHLHCLVTDGAYEEQGNDLRFLAAPPPTPERMTAVLAQVTTHADMDAHQFLARLIHPNVVAVFEAGVHDSRVYLAMEYVHGVDLQQWLAAGPRRWREVAATFLQAGAGLLAAHKVGLVHRDFKPANVLVGDDGRVRVADFGLATPRGGVTHNRPVPEDIDLHRSRAARSQRLAATIAGPGALVGTPAYMAPEMLHGAPATAATDQYALCVALFEALYGHRPFAGDRLGRLKLSKDGLARRDHLVLATCRDAGLPVALSMAGGYARELDDIVDIHLRTVQIAAELDLPGGRPAVVQAGTPRP